MFKNYFKIAWRSLKNNRAYSTINIVGLASSLAACILLLLWVQDEMSFDAFHPKVDSIYKVSASFDEHGKNDFWGGVPAPVASFSKKDIPGVVDACRMNTNYRIGLLEYNNKKFTDIKGGFADPSFFTMFNFPLIRGNKKQPFTDDLSVVLSESTAKKFFGNGDPIGKSIRADDKKIYHVTGVIKDMPKNSSINFDMIYSFDMLKRDYDGTGYWKALDEDWGNYYYETYLQFTPTASIAKVAAQLKQIHRVNHKGDPNSDFYKSFNYLLLPMKKMHLYAADGQEAGMKTVKLFFIVACIILLIACINYVNLVTARSAKRAKEISLRKIIGAARANLFWQFLSEAILIFFISLVVASVLIYMVMPLYNDLAGKQLIFNPLSTNVLTVYGIAFISTLLLAGIYPAITLSSFKPLEAMKGKLSGLGNGGSFRKVLVVIQFTFSIMLIVSTLVISKQLKYLKEKDLGYQKENIIALGNIRKINDHYDAVRSELMKQSGIASVTASGQNIMGVGASTGDIEWDGKSASQGSFTVNQLNIEKDFLQVMNVPLVAGKGFTGTPADSSNFIINETAAQAMGLKDPIGKRLKFHDVNGTIVGVAKDFHFENLHVKIRPMVLYNNKDWHGDWLYIKTTGKETSAAIAAVDKVWKRYNPEYSMNYKFIDDSFNDIYKADINSGKLFNYFAVITILISCLGLFGLVSYTAESKVKEIGVRKVLGASVTGIVNMLSKDFLKLILIAVIIAFPSVWWVLNKMLEEYAYRTEISFWVFILAGAITLLISLVTMSFQAIRAALANPVKSLRTE